MSLRDQFLKAGLVTADAVKKAETEKRKQQHQSTKQSAKGKQAGPSEEQRQRQAEQEAKRQRDRELNARKEAERKRQADLARAKQIIEANRQNDPQAEDRYNFQEGRFVRSVRVTDAQRRLIAMGKLGVARMDARGFDFVLIPREAALKVQEICPERLSLLFEECDSLEDDDWGWN
ncbi:DUF2058 family protein [Plasticicumulans acidivorans]|uniref:Nucleoprotein/polynucleotide-associated enzyme n=1 Tax=Plasticicumulans acidivorans TaxID=886464 RepID=A0A317N012_9GAMM|nr:DUF2058 family protein [Plasticicumulans acidivorans]PWV65911.1 hypothetical protein C7443_101397 [Plasticicumulans acidivorans]